jgi:hypothetical protein
VESDLTWGVCVGQQDDIYKQEYYLSLMDFRELTLKRLQKYVQQRFFSVEDYLNGALNPVAFIA